MSGFPCFCCMIQAEAFPIKDYHYSTITDLFSSIKSYKWPSSPKSDLRVAFWNASNAPFKTFLDVTEEDIQETVSANIIGPFAFSRQAILNFKENEIDELGRRGTLLFTGATASLRGNVYTSAFAAGKFGLRALSQSLAKEFGKENIHVAQVRNSHSPLSTNLHQLNDHPTFSQLLMEVLLCIIFLCQYWMC